MITSNNADVIRLVGTNHTYAAGNGVATFKIGSGAFLNYNYDISGYPTATERIIARAVTPLDDTPGGPDLAGQAPVAAGGTCTTVCGPEVPGQQGDKRRRRHRRHAGARATGPAAVSPREPCMQGI